MKKILTKFLRASIMAYLERNLTVENVRFVLEKACEMAKEAAEKTSTKIDDKALEILFSVLGSSDLIEKIVQHVREMMNSEELVFAQIPDSDEVTPEQAAQLIACELAQGL